MTIRRLLALLLSVACLLGTAVGCAPAEPPDPVFTLLWTSDPQWYSFKYQDIITHQNEWIAENYEEYDIRYMFHTGDFVNLPHNHEEWAVMDESYKDLDECGLPYGVLAGNHDVDGSDHTEFSQYFGEARYKDNEWYGESYEDNFGHYDLMTIADVPFIFVYMGYNESYKDADYEWLDRVLNEHSDRIAVLNFHDYLNAAGERSSSGELFFYNTVLTHPNVRMVLCGHNYAAHRKIDKVDDDGDGEADRTVYQIIANYQNTRKGGNGFMRFMECDVENGTIKTTTYSPLLDEYGSDYETKTDVDEYGTRDSFTIPFDFSVPAPKPEGFKAGVVVK